MEAEGDKELERSEAVRSVRTKNNLAFFSAQQSRDWD